MEKQSRKFSTVSGLGLLATKFSDGVERGYYLGLAFTGFGLGVLIGPPFGSVLFQFCGLRVPFYILAAIGVVDGILQSGFDLFSRSNFDLYAKFFQITNYSRY